MAKTNRERLLIDISPRSFLYFFGFIGAIFFAWHIIDIIILLFVSLIFAAALDPTVKAMQRRGLPRWTAISIIYLVFIGLIALTFALVVPTVSQQIRALSGNWPYYQAKFEHLLPEHSFVTRSLQRFSSGLNANSSTIFASLAMATVSLVTGIIATITFLVLTFYMLLGGKDIGHSVVELLPDPKLRKTVVQLGEEISRKLGYWLRGQALLAFIIFLASLVGLSVLHVDYALTLAVIAGIFELVPLLGPYLGALPAILVALTVSPSRGLAVAILFLFIQQFEAHVVVPQVLRRALGIPPIIILASILVGGKLAGIVGVLIAAPFAAALSIVLSHLLADQSSGGRS